MSEPLLSGKQPDTVSKKKKLGSLCLLCTEECQEECKSNLDVWKNFAGEIKELVWFRHFWRSFRQS